MAEFQKIAKARRRMCDAYKGCKECPLYSLTQGNFCGTKTLNFPEESERIILEWETWHPIMTNGKKFEEVFGSSAEVVWHHEFNAFSKWMDAEYKGEQDERES